MKEKISDVMYDEFMVVYCNSCEHRYKDEPCEDCHRKNMRWSLSREAANEVAEKIMKERRL